MGDSDESRGSDLSSDGTRTERMEVDRPVVVPRNAQSVVRRSLSGSTDMTDNSAMTTSGTDSNSPGGGSTSAMSARNSEGERDATGGLLRRSNSAPMFNGPNMRYDEPSVTDLVLVTCLLLNVC